MSNLQEGRDIYKPFHYQKAFDYFEKQSQSHWLPTEVSMASDIADWDRNLSETERSVIGNVLKGFTQMELHVNDYWARKVAQWFPHPEICMMASTFSGMEAIHTWGYSYLNDSLGLDDYEAFLEDEATMNKLDRLKDVDSESVEDIARSLAIFSGFTEGVHLFSSFAILLNFSRFNKLKGVGQIVSWSIRDESMHSDAGCWLFNTLCDENPDVREKVKQDVYDAAKLTIELENKFIDMIYGEAHSSSIQGLDKEDLKEYIKYRANTKIEDLGYTADWSNIDMKRVGELEWFDALSSGVELQDFFAMRSTSYSKGVNANWSVEDVFGDVNNG